MGKFKVKSYQYHCGDLFDIETHILDLTEHARHLVPNLAPLVGQPLLNSTDFELRVDKSRIYTEDQLVPLIGMIWKVVRFVDDRVHLQQAAGVTKVGYNVFYDYKLAQINGNQDFSGTKADREYWTHDTMDAKKDILKVKAHEKLLLAGNQARGPSGNANSTAGQNGVPNELSNKTKRNRCQRAHYNKRKRAKKAQQLAQNNQKGQAPAVTVKSDP